MAENGTEVVRRYLQDAIAAESGFESQLHSFAAEGDDAEVKAAFALHAEETAAQQRKLAARLEELGGKASATKSVLAHLFGFSPKAAQLTHSADERTVQNLIVAFSVENSECAMYEALANVAQANGDPATESLAKEIQQEEKRTAEKVWSFIPSRSKIAFNMLTALEVDPSVETRTTEDRIT